MNSSSRLYVIESRGNKKMLRFVIERWGGRGGGGRKEEKEASKRKEKKFKCQYKKGKAALERKRLDQDVLVHNREWRKEIYILPNGYIYIYIYTL